MAESWGPYRAALSYSSKRGIAKSFIFFGTARTSFKINGQLKVEDTSKQAGRTSFGHLDQEQFFALLWLGDMSRDKRVLHKKKREKMIISKPCLCT